MGEMETDTELRGRILAAIPYEKTKFREVGMATGEELDVLANRHGIARLGPSHVRLTEQMHKSYQEGWAEGYYRGRQDAFKDIEKMKSDMKKAVLKALSTFERG